MPSRRPSIATLLLVVTAVGATVPWLAGYVLPAGGTRSLGIAALAGYGSLAVAAVGILAAGLRRWMAVAVVALLLAPQAYCLAPLYVGDGQPEPGRPTLRLMTANLLFGGADTKQIVDLVRRNRVDVLALEELSPGASAGLQRAGLMTELPYAISRPATGAAGTGLWSRLPLTQVPQRRLMFNACAGDLFVSGRRVRVRAVHPVAPVPPRNWRRDLDILRAQQADDEGVPTLLLGDLNGSVHHHELRRLMGTRWRDAAEADGAGLVRTWSPRARLPSLIDLDHVLIDRGMTVRRWSSVILRRSDHRVVIAEVALR